jgi:Tat protein translocase TatB subunit
VFNLGMSEIVVILVVALVFLGPKKLPELASGLGKMIRELRKATADIKSEIELDETIRKPVEELREAMTLHPEELKRRDRERALREQEEREQKQRDRAEAAARETEAKTEGKTEGKPPQAVTDTAGTDNTVAASAPAPGPDRTMPIGDRTLAMSTPLSGLSPSDKTVAMESPPTPEPPAPIPVPRVPGSVPRTPALGVVPPPPVPRQSAVPPPTPAASRLPPPPSVPRHLTPPPPPAKKA